MTDEVLSQLLQAAANRETVALLTVTRAKGAFTKCMGNHCLLWLEPEDRCAGDLELGALTAQVMKDAREALCTRQHRTVSATDDSGDVQVFVEVQKKPPQLIIVGAGHIAAPLAKLASMCDIEVTVLDDRRQFANRERFPEALNVIAGPYQEELRRLRGQSGFDADTYVVLVTRGHSHDVESLLELLDDPIAYIGMIGSQRRIRAVFQLLESEKGVEPAKLDRVYAPIGLDIGAHTPAEIAVCIMAEIINVMRNGPAVSLSDQLRRQRLSRRQAPKP